jgi:hypothetical protein
MARFSDAMDDTTGEFERSLITASMHSAFLLALSSEHLLSLYTSNHPSVLPMMPRLALRACILHFHLFRADFRNYTPWATGKLYTKTMVLTQHRTGGALVFLGSLMIKNAQEINWPYIACRPPVWPIVDTDILAF